MTPADWVIACVLLVAGVLLFIGLAQVLDAGPPARERGRAARAGAGGRRAARASAADVPPRAEPTVSQAAVPRVPVPAGPGEGLATEAGPAAEAPSAEAAGRSPVERCMLLEREGRYAEVLREVASHVTVAQGALPYETALLWSLAGLAQESLEQPDEARAAYDAAVWVMPGAGGPLPPDLGEHGVEMVERLVERARAAGTASAGSAARLRLALSWLRGVGGEAPEAARARLVEAREWLWRASATDANAFLARQEFELARGLALEALGDPELPAPRREELRELVSTSLAAEIGRLMSRALERLESPAEAQAALERGEAAFRAVPLDLLGDRQRQELARRLWWGFSRLGGQRLEAGSAEEAAGLLTRALRMAEHDPDRRAESRQALVRALDAWGAASRDAVGRRPPEEARGAAAEAARRLGEGIDRALGAGLSPDELAGVIAVSQALTRGEGSDDAH